MQRKFLTSIFIIYTVVLLTQPCEDFQADSLEKKAQTIVTSVSDPIHSDSEPGPETCSPFCICGCCGLTVLHHGFTTLAMTDRITVAETALTAFYQPPTNRTYVDSIWQPPKV
jgi:hypothetical protein